MGFVAEPRKLAFGVLSASVDDGDSGFGASHGATSDSADFVETNGSGCGGRDVASGNNFFDNPIVKLAADVFLDASV